MTASLTIQVFSDLCCPWCIIGVIRLDKVLASMAGEVQATVIHHPRLLAPDTPESGASIRDMLMQRYGLEPSTAFLPAETEARASGIPLDLSKQAYSYPTFSAHALIRHAGPKGTQHALARAFLEAYFLDASNIADVEVLILGSGVEYGQPCGEDGERAGPRHICLIRVTTEDGLAGYADVDSHPWVVKSIVEARVEAIAVIIVGLIRVVIVFDSADIRSRQSL